MATSKSALTVPSTRPLRAAAQDLTIVAVAAASALVLTLAVRPITSYDIGYHLAYGDHFLDTGEIVRTNRFIYTKLPVDLAEGKDLPPGCRYDPATGTYWFVNANWLSQVVMAAVHRVGGMIGLSVLQAALVAGIVAVVVAALRRGGVAWHWIAPALILMALTGYERFNLRPELFGYLVLASQWALLMHPRFGWKQAVGVAALQVLAVNLHSYFLLGLGLAAAMCLDGLLRWGWAKMVARTDVGESQLRLKWLAVGTGGALAACLCNPAFVRGAIFPIQTLLYLKRHQVLGATPSPQSHPWAFVGEFVSTLDPNLRGTRAAGAYVVALGVACASMLAAVVRSRWGWAAVLVGMAAVSGYTRRNIALGGIILTPLSLIALADAWAWLRRKGRLARPAALARPVAVGVSAAAAALAVWWTVAVVTNSFYSSERRSWRFGVGVSKAMIPVEAAEWINAHDPPGNVWCDFANSSNLMYLTRPHRSVPVLTNTWAYPPAVMRQVMYVTAGVAPFQPVVDEYGIGTVVLRYSRAVPPLIGILARSPDFSVVQIGVKHVVFVRNTGPTAALAQARALSESDFDVDAHAARLTRADPVEASALHGGARLLSSMGWTRSAIELWRRAIQPGREDPEAMFGLGWSLTQRGRGLIRLAEHYRAQNQAIRADFAQNRAREDFQEAAELLEKVVARRPDYPTAKATLEWLRGQLLSSESASRPAAR